MLVRMQGSFRNGQLPTKISWSPRYFLKRERERERERERVRERVNRDGERPFVYLVHDANRGREKQKKEMC